MRTIVASLFLVAASIAFANPCTGVGRDLNQDRKKELSVVVENQLHIDSADILQSYAFHGWFIIYVNTHVTDETFLFFNGDPLTTKYITAWGGSAESNQEEQIKKWVLKNAQGIPGKLASCFAWHVTKDRDL